MADFDVTRLGEADHLEVGETAPDFVRPLVSVEYWEDVALSDLLAAGRVALVFHPMDGAFPSTYIWNEIRDRQWAALATVVGVSISSPYEHHDFIVDRGIEDYRLFSDPANGVGEAFGITHDLDGMTGINEPRPAVFVVEPDRSIVYAWVATEWPAYPEYDEVETVLAGG